MIRTSCTALFTLVALLLAARASAQQINGALRLHLETSVLGFESLTANEEGPPPSETTTTTTFGPGGNGLGFGGGFRNGGLGFGGLGFGLGFGVSDNLVIGGNVTLQFRSENPDNGRTRSGQTLTLMPYIEALFGDGSTRPFLGGALLLSFDNFDDVSTTMFGLAGLGGVHIFMTDSYSLDISGRLYVATGSASDDRDRMTVDTSLTQFGLIALLGVSGWSI